MPNTHMFTVLAYPQWFKVAGKGDIATYLTQKLERAGAQNVAINGIAVDTPTAEVLEIFDHTNGRERTAQVVVDDKAEEAYFCVAFDLDAAHNPREVAGKMMGGQFGKIYFTNSDREIKARWKKLMKIQNYVLLGNEPPIPQSDVSGLDQVRGFAKDISVDQQEL